MRLLHVSDWHLGRVTGRVSRAPDHDAVIARTCEVARDACPDLVIHTGDLFDAVRPPYEEMSRGVEALRRLAEVAPVLVVCGNHDSPSLFRVFAALHGAGGRITFADRPRVEPYLFPAADGGRIRVAALPFVHANRAVTVLETHPSAWRAAYADRLAGIWGHLRTGLADGHDDGRDVLVLAAHLHLAGATLSGSERRVHVGDDYATRAEHLPAAAYAAFGHIHRPQAIPGTATGHYAGSPVPLDFGEEGEAKSVLLVEAAAGRRARVETVPLDAGRPLRTIRCGLEDLPAQAEAARGALCRVLVRTAAPTAGLEDRVRAALGPAAVVLEVVEDCAGERLTALGAGGRSAEADAPLDELFRDYLAAEGTPGAVADRVLGAFRALLRAADEEREPELPGMEALDGLTGVEGDAEGADAEIERAA